MQKKINLIYLFNGLNYSCLFLLLLFTYKDKWNNVTKANQYNKIEKKKFFIKRQKLKNFPLTPLKLGLFLSLFCIGVVYPAPRNAIKYIKNT